MACGQDVTTGGGCPEIKRMVCVQDLTIGIVGEAHAGKAALVEALKSDRGLCKQHDASSKSSSRNVSSPYELHHFNLPSPEGGSAGGTIEGGEEVGGNFCSAVVMATDILDEFVRNVKVDLYLLVVDMTTLEIQRGTQHLFNRHVNRLQMWLTALYEVGYYSS